MKYNPMTRRLFLQGLGGSLLSIPLLPSLIPKAHAAAANPQMRFAMILGQLGRDMSQWYPNIDEASMPQVAPGVYATPFSQIPKPLSFLFGSNFNPVLNKMSILRGLDCVSYNGMHNSSVPTTGSSYDPKISSGFGYSIDAVLEESTKFYPILPFVGALRTTPDVKKNFSDFASFSYTSKISTGQKIDTEWNPLQVYNRILDASGVNLANQRSGRLRNVTDLVMESFKQTMTGRQIASEDKIRLDSYMAMLTDTHKQLAVVAPLCGGATSPGSPSVMTEVHKAMMRVEIAALACGTTRIVMHSITHSGDTENPRWHDYAHAGQHQDFVNPATGRSYLSDINKFSMDLVAYFLTEMDKVPDANGGTLLDNTLFMYGNEDGDGDHQHFDLPVFVAGGQGKLRLGQYLDYRPRPLQVLFGKPRGTLYAGRPYNNMLVTAFRALGLGPDDYQKFGQQGFGRYDMPKKGFELYYNQYLGAKVNDPLPYLYLG